MLSGEGPYRSPDVWQNQHHGELPQKPSSKERFPRVSTLRGQSIASHFGESLQLQGFLAPWMSASGAPFQQHRHRAAAAKLTCSIDVLISDRGAKGLGEDSHVEPKRPVLDVIDVMLDALCHLVHRLGFPAVPAYLGPSGDSGF